MKVSLIFAAALGLAVFFSGQSDAEQLKSPKEVLEQFVKMELAGTRLAPEGWHKTTHFFVRPSLPVAHPKILVVSDGFGLTELRSEHTSVVLTVFFDKDYGDIDSALRFRTDGHTPFPPSRFFCPTPAIRTPSFPQPFLSVISNSTYVDIQTCYHGP